MEGRGDCWALCGTWWCCVVVTMVTVLWGFFVKCQKCFPYYSSDAITMAIKGFKGNPELTKDGFLSQSETEYRQTRTQQSRFTECEGHTHQQTFSSDSETISLGLQSFGVEFHAVFGTSETSVLSLRRRPVPPSGGILTSPSGRILTSTSLYS